MNLYGTWGPHDAPYVPAFVSCPSLEISFAVSFLIDTGASRTTILDSDAIRIGLDYSKLDRFIPGTTGIGGVVDTYIVPNVSLIFITDEGIHEEEFEEILVLRHIIKKKEEQERIKKLPSLLGRDFTNKLKLVLNRREELVLLTDK